MGRGFDNLYLNSKCNRKGFSISVLCFTYSWSAISRSVSVLLFLSPKDSETAPNSFLTKINEKGFWRFATDMIFYNYFRLTHSRGDLRCKPSDHRSLARHYMDYSHPNIERWRRPSQPQVWTPTQIHSLCFFTSDQFGQLWLKPRRITARYEREQCPLQGPWFCMWVIWSQKLKENDIEWVTIPV